MTLIDDELRLPGSIDVPSILGLEEARAKVRERVLEITQSAETEGDITFELCEYGVGSTGGNLHEVIYEIAAGAEAVVDELLKVAQKDALDRGRSGGKCRYVVRALRGDRQIPGRCLFALEVSFEENDNGDVDELPTDRGLTAQAMRHVEICVKVAVGSAKEQIVSLTKLLKEKDDAISQMMRAQMDQFKLWQEMSDAKLVRDMEIMKFRNDEQRKEKIAGALEQGLPIVFNKFLGQKALVEHATPIEGMLEGLLSSLQPQLPEIATTGKVELDLMQRASLQEIVLALLAKKEALEKPASEKAANGAASPQ